MRRNGIVEHIYVEPNLHEPLGKRIVIALNHALSKACLEDYDYLLRVDADVMLPKRFIEENLKVKADCVGTAGYAVLLKMNCFIKVFNGQFPEVAVEDTYIALKLLSLGYSVKPWVLPPILREKAEPVIRGDITLLEVWRCINSVMSHFMLLMFYTMT